jgi:predicted HAD superfamily Cof-like phosphohydrolase
MKMQGWQRMVREFHNKFGQPVVEKPTDPNWDRSDLRIRLMREELNETVGAILAGDLVEVADGLADLIYVALGTAIEYGIDMEPIFREVHRSNMAKLPGNMREDGKVTKPEGWEPPRIAEILAEQSK